MSEMDKDQYYAEMLNMMREQGKKDNPTTIQIGTMQSPTSVKIDDLVLNAEDLYIADHLVEGYTRKIKIPYVSGVTVDTTKSDPFGTINSEGAYTDPDTKTATQTEIVYDEGLKKGDLVAVQRLDNAMYVILERVVRA